mgnify:FL=1
MSQSLFVFLQLLTKTIELTSLELLESFINRRGFHLIASQLNNQPYCSDKIVNICAQLINGNKYVCLYLCC